MQHINSTNVLWRANYNDKKSDKYFSQHGQGRDGYILNTSTNGSSSDRFDGAFKYQNSPRDKPTYNEKRVKYFSDGQGRDTYIIRNSPGYFEYDSGCNLKTRYQESFRNYDSPGYSPTNRLNKKSLVMMSTNMFRITAKEVAAYRKQRMLSTQLSQPKMIDTDALNAHIQEKMEHSDWNRTRALHRYQMSELKSPQNKKDTTLTSPSPPRSLFFSDKYEKQQKSLTNLKQSSNTPKAYLGASINGNVEEIRTTKREQVPLLPAINQNVQHSRQKTHA